MMQLVTRHADSKTAIQMPGYERSAVARAREYVHANACRNITLDELAKVAFLSPFHLLRVFRDEIGLPPHAFQTQLRIERAKELLRAGFSITQIALTTGFFDQAHFSKQFKRYVGISPGKFITESTN
jgi:AraC-like DNA-binding protein